VNDGVVVDEIGKEEKSGEEIFEEEEGKGSDFPPTLSFPLQT